MASPLIFLNELYCRDAAYFQRMLEFFLQSRFAAVRIYCLAKPKESVFFSIEGELIRCSNIKIRFPTLTDWYNSVTGKQIPEGDTSIFSEIHISNRMSLQSILSIVTHKEVEEFLDLKYRSSFVYAFILRRLKARCIPCKLTRDQSFRIHWQGRTYIVKHNLTVSDGAFSVGPFLDYVCSSETTLMGIYWEKGEGKHILLTEDVGTEPTQVLTQVQLVHDHCVAELELMADMNHDTIQKVADEIQEEVAVLLTTLRQDTTAKMNDIRQEVYAYIQSQQQLVYSQMEAQQKLHMAEMQAQQHHHVTEEAALINMLRTEFAESQKGVLALIQDMRGTIFFQQQAIHELIQKSSPMVPILYKGF